MSLSLAYGQNPEFSDDITGLDSLENEIIKKSGSWITWKKPRRLEPLNEGGKTMLYEATIAFLSLMFVTWAAAVWASYREEESSTSSNEEKDQRSAA